MSQDDEEISFNPSYLETLSGHLSCPASSPFSSASSDSSTSSRRQSTDSLSSAGGTRKLQLTELNDSKTSFDFFNEIVARREASSRKKKRTKRSKRPAHSHSIPAHNKKEQQHQKQKRRLTARERIKASMVAAQTTELSSAAQKQHGHDLSNDALPNCQLC